MKKLALSCVAVGALAAATAVQPTSATASEAVLLTENEMDQISAGAGGVLLSDLLAVKASALAGKLDVDLKKLDAKTKNRIKKIVAEAKARYKGKIPPAERKKLDAKIKKIVVTANARPQAKGTTAHSSVIVESSSVKSGGGIVSSSTSMRVSVTSD